MCCFIKRHSSLLSSHRRLFFYCCLRCFQPYRLPFRLSRRDYMHSVCSALARCVQPRMKKCCTGSIPRTGCISSTSIISNVGCGEIRPRRDAPCMYRFLRFRMYAAGITQPTFLNCASPNFPVCCSLRWRTVILGVFPCFSPQEQVLYSVLPT